MKISILTSTAERCGIATYTRHLTDGLRKCVDLTVVPVWDQSATWDKYISESAARLNDSDVVHVQHEYAFWGSVLPGRNRYFEHISRIERPIVLTAHTLNPTGEILGLNLPASFARRTAKRILAAVPAYRRTIERETFAVADRIIIHDPDAAARLKARGIPESGIRIIPMGVPLPESGSGDDFRRQFGLGDRRLITVFGFVRPGRGYEAAMSVIESLGSDAALVIAGGPQTEAQQVYLESLMSTVRAKGLQDKVIVTGYLPDEIVPGAMRAADVILCSQEVGTGSYTVQLALAYGRPIVASDLPCFTYPERTHRCMLTFRRGEAQGMAAKLRTVLEDTGLREGLSARALGYAAEHTWDKIAERTAEVYRELE